MREISNHSSVSQCECSGEGDSQYLLNCFLQAWHHGKHSYCRSKWSFSRIRLVCKYSLSSFATQMSNFSINLGLTVWTTLLPQAFSLIALLCGKQLLFVWSLLWCCFGLIYSLIFWDLLSVFLVSLKIRNMSREFLVVEAGWRFGWFSKTQFNWKQTYPAWFSWRVNTIIYNKKLQ